jgi:hypothetical protein
LGLTALLARLDRALEAGGARDLPERQRTMRATLRWSYDLLSEEEKRLFRKLGVFAGGFALEAAEAIGVEPGAAGDVGAGGCARAPRTAGGAVAGRWLRQARPATKSRAIGCSSR